MARSPKIILCITVFGLSLCSKIDYSIWEVDVPTQSQSAMEANLNRVRELPVAEGPLTIALIGDIHVRTRDLLAAVEEINREPRIQFVVLLGDLTNSGLKSEFEAVHEVLTQLRVPYLSVAGNHDLLSNGALVYERMFGPLKSRHQLFGRGFVFWNNSKWESEADIDWLATNLAAAGPGNILFAHTPPDTSVFTKAELANWKRAMVSSGTAASIHAHLHMFDYWYQNNTLFVIADYIANRPFTLLEIWPDRVILEENRGTPLSIAPPQPGFRQGGDETRSIRIDSDRGILRVSDNGSRNLGWTRLGGNPNRVHSFVCRRSRTADLFE